MAGGPRVQNPESTSSASRTMPRRGRVISRRFYNGVIFQSLLLPCPRRQNPSCPNPSIPCSARHWSFPSGKLSVGNVPTSVHLSRSRSPRSGLNASSFGPVGHGDRPHSRLKPKAPKIRGRLRGHQPGLGSADNLVGRGLCLLASQVRGRGSDLEFGSGASGCFRHDGKGGGSAGHGSGRRPRGAVLACRPTQAGDGPPAGEPSVADGTGAVTTSTPRARNAATSSCGAPLSVTTTSIGSRSHR